MIDRDKAFRILSEIGQEHVLKYFDELNETEQKELLSQIEITDFSVLVNLAGDHNSGGERGSFEPLGAVTIKDIASESDRFTQTGVEALKAGKVAAVLLAGGQGTRLGFDKPKGMFNIGVDTELYIFQCLINNLMDVVKLAGAWVPLYIMTSEKNNSETVEFFKEKNYFGYDPAYIRFFI